VCGTRPDTMRHSFVVIEGNIGSGKTSLSSALAREYDAKLILEEFADNPFLPRFYEDPDRYGFQVELAFLAERYGQFKQTDATPDLFKSMTIADYHFYKSLIFARTNLDSEEFRLYSNLFNIIYSSLPKPDLVVYLYLSINNLQRNIQKRGRPYEQEITNEYLQSIQDSYFEFFKRQTNMSILVVDTNNIDFVNNPSDYEQIKQLIDRDYPVGINRILL